MTFREARKSRKLTQEELAEKSGVNQAYISQIERGEIRYPSWDRVSRLCRALRYRPEELFPVEHEVSL